MSSASNSEAFGLLGLSVAGITVQISIAAFGVMQARKAAFDDEFMAKPEVRFLRRNTLSGKTVSSSKQVREITDEFQAIYGTQMEMGYPDMGNGKLGQLLDTAAWSRLALAQRVHQNYVEALPLTLGLMVANTPERPRFVAGCTALFILGRALYAKGYTTKGPKGRFTGAILADIAQVLLLGGAVLSGLRASGVLEAVKGLVSK